MACSRRRARPFAPAAVLLLTLGAVGCARHGVHVIQVLENQRPEVVLTEYPGSSTNPVFYIYELSWTGFDSDGRVDHYIYAVDPPTLRGADTAWVVTTANRITLTFRSSTADSSLIYGLGFHEFALKAVDDQGAASPTLSRAFYSYTVAPTVQIVSPTPNHLLIPTLTISPRITWTGTDPDGRTTKKPVKYKWKVFSRHAVDFDFLVAIADPDSIRRYYAPNFATWDSTGADEPFAQLSNLLPGDPYLFAVVAFDEAGAYSPVMSQDINMIYFYVALAGALGPRLTLYNSFFSFTYPMAEFTTDPQDWVRIEVPSGQSIPFNWYGTPAPGSAVSAYRWCMDNPDIYDETRRTDQFTDTRHWSDWALGTREAVVGPFSPPASGEQHLFYVEARDNSGNISLGTVNFTLVTPTFDRPLLFVDDTRLAPDMLDGTGCVDRDRSQPSIWPSAAELDTFFFAHGSVPWRCYPAGTLSRPGIFSGYDFDTLGTRSFSNLIIPISRLARYRHIVWSVDYAGAFDGAPGFARDPYTMLRLTAQPNGPNTVSLYAALGGHLWMQGGGVATATQLDWESNPANPNNVYSSSNGELAPGRFMWEVAHWHSEITVLRATQLVESGTAVGGWPGAPDYSQLPFLLQYRTSATDPVPPRRTSSEFYVTSFITEFLDQPNDVLEEKPDGTIVPVLDTLYNAAGGGLTMPFPAMTLYHGSVGPPVVFSGFPLWFFRRTQVIALADFVLQQIWGLARQPVSRELQPGITRAAAPGPAHAVLPPKPWRAPIRPSRVPGGP